VISIRTSLRDHSSDVAASAVDFAVGGCEVGYAAAQARVFTRGQTGGGL